MCVMSVKMHGALKASIAKPAKHSLCSVREKDNPDDEADNCKYGIAPG